MSLKPSKVYSTPSLFKDYDKATKDLITKNVIAGGKWKVESKFKTPPGTFSVKPQADETGAVCADVEYVSENGGNVKVHVTPGLYNDLKTTVTYNTNGQKVEVVMQKKKGLIQYELSHETCVALMKRASINEKINAQGLELGMSLDVAPNCQIGCAAAYSFAAGAAKYNALNTMKHCDWSLGCRYAAKGYEFSVISNQLKTYRTSLSLPLALRVRDKSYQFMLACRTECGRCIEGGWKGSAAIEAPCLLVPGNKIIASVDKGWNYAASYVAKMADSWTMTVTMHRDRKVGVQLTHC